MEITPELVGIIGIIAATLTAILTTLFNVVSRYWEKKSEREFQARQRGESYYRPLYGYVAVLDEMARGYNRSLETGKAKVFSFKDFKYKELTSKEMLDEYLRCYDEFSGFYIKKKREGYELFISEELKKSLIELWAKADEFSEDNKKLEDDKEIEAFRTLTDKTTRLMENLFGLS